MTFPVNIWLEEHATRKPWPTDGLRIISLHTLPLDPRTGIMVLHRQRACKLRKVNNPTIPFRCQSRLWLWGGPRKKPKSSWMESHDLRAGRNFTPHPRKIQASYALSQETTFENPTQKRGPTEGSAGTALTTTVCDPELYGKRGKNGRQREGRRLPFTPDWEPTRKETVNPSPL